MAREWLTDDKVRLVTGGPAMVVLGEATDFGSGDKLVVCQWFDGNVYHEEKFSGGSLVEASDTSTNDPSENSASPG